MSVWRWSDRLCPVAESHRITLGEGRTPLVRSRRLGPSLGLNQLYFKLESANPTGSYKDRFAAVAVSHALASGVRRIVATSSGNAGASLAAYCAAGGIPLHITTLEAAPADKLAQMRAYGASVVRVQGYGPQNDVNLRVCFRLRQRGQEPDCAFLISSFRDCPEGMTGIQTIAYELAEELPSGIDHVFCCAGSGGLALGVARGFQQLGLCTKVECVQPVGNATIAGPLRTNAATAEPVSCQSQISGLQVSIIIDGQMALDAVRQSGGGGHLVTDEQAWSAQLQLARQEGIFAEPAGAVPFAGLQAAVVEGRVDADAAVVCLVTGVGFKDGAAVQRMPGLKDMPPISLAEWEYEAS